MPPTPVSVVSCASYNPEALHAALVTCLEPLGGMQHFVRPGMKVLLKPNLLSANALEKAVTTHPALVQAVTKLVQEAGGIVTIGDSPSGATSENPKVLQETGMVEVARKTGAQLGAFESSSWTRHNDFDYHLARPVVEADLVINLPKQKTHNLTLFTGAVKNLFGTVVGGRKREIHVRAPGVEDFSQALVDILELVHPALNIMDGVLGLEGNGPGPSGTPHAYHCLAASTDAVALDTTIALAMGFHPGEVLHLAQAAQRGIGVADPRQILIKGDPAALVFGKLLLPTARWYLNPPSWLSAPIHRAIKLRPVLNPALCKGCGDCSEACPQRIITPGEPPLFDLKYCIGCMCCAEVCPQGAITVSRNLLARLIGVS